MTSKTFEKLGNPEYRDAFVASQIEVGIPFQIRALMKERGWTQEQLAEKTGMRQPSVSGLMSPGKTKPNIETLRRLAKAFDCGLAVRFVPFSELVDWSENFDPESFSAVSFVEESSSLNPGGESSSATCGVVNITDYFNQQPPKISVQCASAKDCSMSNDGNPGEQFFLSSQAC